MIVAGGTQSVIIREWIYCITQRQVFVIFGMGAIMTLRLISIIIYFSKQFYL